MLEARTPQAADLALVRSTTNSLGLGDVAVQEFGDPQDVLIRVEAQPGDGDAQMAVVSRIQEALVAAIPGTEIRRVEVVGPKVSGELVIEGILAIGLAVLVVLVYIWLRFEWQFSLGAVVALIHDVTLTIGIFSVLQLEFNLSIIAALLTIVGYSLNDTVVVFDRVRENLRRYKTMSLFELLNLSINETLSRTLMTSGTTLVALGSLYIFGGEVIRGFTFAMIWGIVVGTYSSIFVAAVVLLHLGVNRNWSNEDEDGKGPKGVQFGGAQV
jgi:preprotein translocase subunit SecF